MTVSKWFKLLVGLGLALGVGVHSNAQEKCEPRSPIIRVNGPDRTLVVVGKIEDIESITRARATLAPLAAWTKACHPEWKRRWYVTFLKSDDPAFRKINKDNLGRLRGEELHRFLENSLGHYNAESEILLLHPMLRGEKKKLKVRLLKGLESTSGTAIQQ